MSWRFWVFALVLLTGPPAFGQKVEEKDRYSNTPDELIPYARGEPYKRYFVTPLEYNGPGREKPEPADVDTVKIGLLVPYDQIVSPRVSTPDQYVQMGRDVLRGAELAVEEANARGGYRGRLPYALVKYNDPILEVKDTWLWGPFSNHVVDLIYRHKVWAIFGSVGGENTHILIRIALRAEVPVMTPADTDPTYPETRIPWAFRCIADDRLQCYVLAKYAYERMGYRRVAALRVNARYGRVGIKEFREAAQRLGHPLLAEMKYRFGDTDFRGQLERLRDLRPDAVLTWGNARESALILKQMREMGMRQPLLGSDRMVTEEFLEVAGRDAEGTVAGYPWDPTRDDAVLTAFRARYEKRFGASAGTYAAHAYDGMNMLLQAIERAGLNRARVRDALDDMRTHVYRGVTGEVPLNDIYSDVGPVAIAVAQNGRFIFMSEEKAGVSLPRRVAVKR